jgi:hypothetical protein
MQAAATKIFRIGFSSTLIQMLADTGVPRDKKMRWLW